MSALYNSTIGELHGLSEASTSSEEWLFHGKIISKGQYMGFEADIAAIEKQHYSGNSSTKPGSESILFDAQQKELEHESSSTEDQNSMNVSIPMYSDTTASVEVNYASTMSALTLENMTVLLTPSASGDTSCSDDKSSHIDVLEYESVSQYTYSDFPKESSGSTPLESWETTPEAHEHLAYRLSHTTKATDHPKKRKYQRWQ